MRMLRIAAIPCMSLLLAGLLATPAHAAGSGFENPRVRAVLADLSATGSLSDADRALLSSYPDVAARTIDPAATTVELSGASRAGIGCGPVERIQTERTLFGNVAWKFRHRLNRCWNGSQVTSVTNRYAEFFEVDSFFVPGVVNVDRVSAAAPAARITSAFSRQISNCAGGPGFLCTSSRLPMITLTVRGDGTFTTSGTNSV